MGGATRRFYDQLLKEHGDDPDYGALNQGRIATQERHAAVFGEVWACTPTVVLDYGCGTGLILEGAHQRDRLPGWYVGYDILEERKEALERRCDSLGMVPWDYHLVNSQGSVRSQLRTDAEIGLAVGVAGFAGCHTHAQLMELIVVLAVRCDRWAVTFPRYYSEGVLGHEHLCRFDVADIAHRIAMLGIAYKIRYLSREAMVYWA